MYRSKRKYRIYYALVLFAFLAMFYAKKAIGQDQGFISTSTGLAIPIGDFASNFRAESSYHVGIEGGYYFTEKRNFGIGTKIAYSVHGLSSSANSAFESVLIEENIPYILQTDFTQWDVLDWGAGLYAQAHFGEAVSLEGKLRLGLLWITSPEFSTTLQTPNNIAFNGQSSITETVFNLSGEVVLKYNIGWASVKLYSSLISVSPQINTTTEVSPNWPIDYTYRDTYLANVSIITFGLGVETRF